MNDDDDRTLDVSSERSETHTNARYLIEEKCSEDVI